MQIRNLPVNSIPQDQCAVSTAQNCTSIIYTVFYEWFSKLIQVIIFQFFNCKVFVLTGFKVHNFVNDYFISSVLSSFQHFITICNTGILYCIFHLL